jgi:hypothetical protein
MAYYSVHTRNSPESSTHSFFLAEKKRKSDAGKVVCGPDLRTPHKRKYPDAVYLEMRRLYETGGLRKKQLVTLLGCPLSYAHAVCEYRIAAYLMPDERNTPYCNLEDYRDENCNDQRCTSLPACLKLASTHWTYD